jgi:predicted porin
MLTIGRWDVHYGKSPSDIAGKGALKAAAISIMDYIGSTPIANTTRTPNIIKWDSPNWSGFAITAGYSTNAGGASEADITSTERKGSATVINPSFQAANFKVEYSNWNSKPDGSLADQKGDVINAWYKTGGLKIGGAWNKSSIKNAGVKLERTAMMIGGSFTTGPHEIHFHADRAGKVKADGTDLDDTSAKMMALAYVYNLSKRTAMSVTYAKITNDPNIDYHFFTDTGNGATGLASTGSQPLDGEDPQLIAVILRHAF